MDLVLHYGDEFVMDHLYKKLPDTFAYKEIFMNKESVLHQATTLWIISSITGFIIYFLLSTIAFYCLFDRNLLNHRKFVPGQIQKEIYMSLFQIPLGALYTVPFWILEINGYSKIYYNVKDYEFSGYPDGGWLYFCFSIIGFLVFSDFFIYWIHRSEHHPSVYYWLHKPHHTWKVPTPFSSFAFHPLDGYFQSLPYHIFPFLFPLQAHLYLVLFFFVQIWTVGIHDNVFWTANHIVNGAAHHTIHHLEFNYNYGQYFTLWDRIFGTHKFPEDKASIQKYFEKALEVNAESKKKK